MYVLAATQLHDAGEASTLPTVSVALTWKLCAPTATVTLVGLVQVENAAPSRLQAKVALSSAVNVNVAVVAPGPFEGPELSVVCGGVVSIVQVRAIKALWLPAASSPRTENVCVPSTRL